MEVITLSSEEEQIKKSDIQKKKKLKKLRKDKKQLTLINFMEKQNNNYFTIYTSSSLPVTYNSTKTTVKSINQNIQLEETEKNITESCNTLELLPEKIYVKPLEQQQEHINLAAVESDNSDATEDQQKTRERKNKPKKTMCPSYKLIEGSLLAVDAFRYGNISSVHHYFLTHFHSDHYIGLRKEFNNMLYCSEITSLLIQEFIGLSRESIIIMQVKKPFFVDAIKITPFDANHCPGALILLFQFPDGREILHTGDFRANDEMTKEVLEKVNSRLDLIYLDTTYLPIKRQMPSQEMSINFMLEKVQIYLNENIGEKSLIVVGAYLIGKEKLWMAIAERFNFRVFLEKERLKAFRAICCCSNYHLLFYKKYVTHCAADADVRVVNMNMLSYPNLRGFLSENQDNWNTILGIIGSGWQNQSFRTGKISLLHIQYSEHSSYNELERFINATKPRNIISTVPVTMSSESTADIPKKWLTT